MYTFILRNSMDSIEIFFFFFFFVILKKLFSVDPQKRKQFKYNKSYQRTEFIQSASVKTIKKVFLVEIHTFRIHCSLLNEKKCTINYFIPIITYHIDVFLMTSFHEVLFLLPKFNYSNYNKIYFSPVCLLKFHWKIFLRMVSFYHYYLILNQNLMQLLFKKILTKKFNLI